MVAVFPEYEMLPDIVGAVNRASKVCWADAELSRPTELASATTVTFNGDSAFLIGTLTIALPPDTVTGASAGTTFTCEMVPTKFSVDILIHPPSVTSPDSDIT